MKYWFVSYAMFTEHFNPGIDNIFMAFDKGHFPFSQAIKKISDVCSFGTRGTRIVILSFREISWDCFIEGTTTEETKKEPMVEYKCSLTVEQREAAMKPFPRESLSRLITLVLNLCASLKLKELDEDLMPVLLSVLWGDNPEYEKAKTLSAPRLPEIIAEIRSLLWLEVNHSAPPTNEDEIREKIRFLYDYLEHPERFAFACNVAIGKRPS
ncbi:MAG: hypothetical protein WCT16_01245 [Candidatus Buchananbacteria bacterium]